MSPVTEDSAPPRTAEEWVAEFIAGWRDPSDPEAFANHFERVCTDDVRMIQPQLPTMVGKAAFREGFVRPTFALIPDLHAVVHDWAVNEAGELVFINFTLAGTLGGKPISWPCIDRIVLRDGLACERRAYFDPTPLLRAVLTRPRAWPGFARIQAGRLAGALRQGGKR